MTTAPTILDEPLVHFGREVCGDLEAGLRREWLVTNGRGGYASGTLAGPATRRYHGLLVASLHPPVDRVVLVGGLDEWVECEGRPYPLSTHEFAGAVTPRGYLHLESFALLGTTPVWRFALGGSLLEKRLCMVQGEDITVLAWRFLQGTAPVSLAVTPLVTARGFHTLDGGPSWQPSADASGPTVSVRMYGGAPAVHLSASAGTFEQAPVWWWDFFHREEAARGLDARSDLFAPGSFHVQLQPGETWTLVLAVGSPPSRDASAALAEAQVRQRSLLERAGAVRARPATQQLVLAADQFLVERATPGERGGSVIAGYHWFNDWGRDAMIALPGLALSTGRHDDAASIFRTFAANIRDGLLPNNFPDDAAASPAYNTADASLWFILAVWELVASASSTALAVEFLPAVTSIVDAHLAGTRFGIGVDPADGLIRAGQPGLQLTWMDARVGDRVVTPRIGKPVEVNALWYNALRAADELRILAGQPPRYAAQAERCRDSFRARFWRPGAASLADVVDGPSGDDWSVRPNQLFALSLPSPLLDPAGEFPILETLARELLVSGALRSLAPSDPAYVATYQGSPAARDSAYHQGTAWTWLLPSFALAWARIRHDGAGALRLLSPLEDHLCDAGLGTVSEILDPGPPHQPRGAIAQAWSVGEFLRAWRYLERAAASAPASSV